MTDLKPCPFCGSEEICLNDTVAPDYVTCIDCGTDGPLADPDGSKWNAAPRREENNKAIQALKMIADHGGTDTDEGLSCTGHWCSDQARWALREIAIEES